MSKRWRPINDLINIQDRLNRLFQDSIYKTAGEWTPAVDICENSDEFVVYMEAPGVSDSLDVQVSEGVLVISGDKPSPLEKGTDSYYRLERPFGHFTRSFALPPGVDISTVSASMKDGVLKVTLGKHNKGAARTIKVSKE